MRKPDTEKVISEAKELGLPTEKAGRSLVWFDEFRDRDESLNKWFFRTQMNSTDITLNTDEKHVEVSGGKLRLHTYRADGTDGIAYTLPQALTTYGKMVFRRGYLEMRAKIPFRHGTWPSFWMLTYEPLMESRLRSEIDIFEIFSSPDTVVCNLHKSLRGSDGKIIARCKLDGTMISERRFKFKNPETLNDEYHIYGMEWTEKELTFLVDDVPYVTLNIADNYTDKEGLEDMDCYQDYHFVILNNFVFTPGHHWHPEAHLIQPEDPCPVDYTVDYIRLYQKDGEDILVED